MTAQRSAAAVLAICAAVRAQIAEIEEDAKAAVDCSYADEKVAAVVDGVVVATTGRYERKPREPFVVLNEEALVDWVEARWPTEITRSVRRAFLNTALYERAAIHDGVLVDDDGEVCEAVRVKDVEVSVRTYLRRTDEALAALKPFMAVSLSDLPELIKGGDA